MSVLQRRALCLLMMMMLAALLAWSARPTVRLADQGVALDLEALVPHQFSGWELDERQSAAVVNPQTGEMQSRIYQQVLSRTYIQRSTGRSVMLSIAYGENQSRSNDLHVPDVCYPASGFRLEQSRQGTIRFAHNEIPVRRLIAQRLQRREPLTYWTIIGDQIAAGSIETKLLALSYGLRGTVPDGMIVRVSSLGLGDDEAFVLQQEFVEALLGSLPAEGRKRLAGV